MSSKPSRHREVHPACFLIVALPVITFWVNGWVVPNIGVPLLDVAPERLLDSDKGYAEAAGRNKFLGALLFFVVIVIVAVIAFAAEMLRPLSRATKAWALVVFVAAQVPVWQEVIQQQDDSIANWRSYHQLGDGVMEQVLSYGDVRLCQTFQTTGQGEARVERFVDDPDKTLFPGQLCTDNPAMQLFRSLIDFIILLSGIGVVSLVLGVILSLSRSPDHVPLEERAFEHGMNQKTARKFLYLAGLMLSSGMFLAMTWMHWPLPLVQEKQLDIYESVVNATLFYYGVFYTLLIVTGFGPVMYLAARRSEALAMENLGAGQPMAQPVPGKGAPEPPTVSAIEKWKAAHGLRISMTEAIQALLATTSPLLTAFAGSFSPV